MRSHRNGGQPAVTPPIDDEKLRDGWLAIVDQFMASVVCDRGGRLVRRVPVQADVRHAGLSGMLAGLERLACLPHDSRDPSGAAVATAGTDNRREACDRSRLDVGRLGRYATRVATELGGRPPSTTTETRWVEEPYTESRMGGLIRRSRTRRVENSFQVAVPG